MSDHLDDDEILIEEDLDSQSLANISQRTWKIAIVDDDEDVHRATEFSLLDVKILNRRLEFIHTYSKAETHERFAVESDIAVVLLDVVMETEHAGLDLVCFIRDELKWRDTRIILRTGQPGYAPEEDAIRDYDINDYKTKNELTRKKLLTALTAAIRSYDQLRTIEASRRGLHQIITSSAAFSMQDGIQGFASGVITQIAALCGVPSEGLLCAQSDESEQSEGNFRYSVIASAGQYKNLMNRPVDEIDNPVIRDALRRALTERVSLFEEHNMTLYFSGRGKRAIAAFIELPYALSDIDHQLLEVFCANLGVCLDNLGLVSQLKNYAFRDQLLMLPNRLKFIEKIGAAIDTALGHQMVVLIDIDDFAEINDVLGHRYGDLLLRAVANRLQQSLGSSVFLARIGGDVFGLLGDERTLKPEALMRLFHDPFVIDDTSHNVSMSMGMVALDNNQQTGADVLKDASIALKRTKGFQRGSYTLFTREMGVEIRERSLLMQHLHKAFDAERLYLMYQPQIELSTRKVVGFEALLRWRTDEGKMISPTEFIPLAEHSGLIISLGAWVLRTSCFTMRQLLDDGYQLDRMGVNVSAIQFRQADFMQLVSNALRDSGLEPHYLELEITESVTMNGAADFEETLDKLKSIGVQIAIDDFGTGFSSLSYLDKLPVDRLKIDRAFVNQIDHQGGPRIAELITQLGKKLGLKVIAEGIETQAHYEALQAMHCDEGQGFLIARPMLESAIASWMTEWK
ncbi:EAL domain-containing protein [Undibacterium sp. LX40W]|uniref:EAL domain-containing protein n=1 Tax=Undibacterium nitidum TaxID=2762298 RepID=A0A923KTL6_9BURK|nr:MULTISPECIES: EAL domain-containing protein [Undibacterium]MBC3882376.1 EAL domain-containing protein [Undibacterium nitidum]MBC3892657.1 EAL domain-containing protein [Undibacterium sp. LX40W]